MRKILVLFILIAVFWSCDLWDQIPTTTVEAEEEEEEEEEEVERVFITFASVSQSYRNTYGEPEEINTYDSFEDDYHTIDWWYWTQGFEVSFIDSPYDDTYGWRVDSEYTFEPIN